MKTRPNPLTTLSAARLILVLFLGIVLFASGLALIVLDDRSGMAWTAGVAASIAKDSWDYRRSQGVWPASLSDVFDSPRLTILRRLYPRQFIDASRIVLDGWGNPITYVPFNDKDGYGVVRCSGPKGSLRRRISRLTETREWLFADHGALAYRR